MNEISKLLKEYGQYLEIEKNRSPKTKAAYERALKKFIDFGGFEKLNDITEDKIRMFRVFLSEQVSLKKNTQSYYIIAIRNFLRYLVKRDYKTVPPERIELPKILKRQIQIIEYDDLERLLTAPDNKDIRSLRDRAILETLFSTGLRISELCDLNRYINLERGEITIRGKGGKLRVVFLSERAKKTIREYLDKRDDAEEALFVSLTKSKRPKAIGRIIPRAIQRIVDYYSRKAGLSDKISPHTLRHLFATDLLINGADLRSVQEILGHASIQTTQIYTHLTNKELREIHRAFHGRRRK